VGFSIYSKPIKENILYQFKIMLSIFFFTFTFSRKKQKKISIYIYIREPSVEDREELLFLLFFFSFPFLSSPIFGEICFIFVREKIVYIRTSGEENATEIRKN
jgi:hypothetical protein